MSSAGLAGRVPPVGLFTKLSYGFGSLAYGVKDTAFKYFLLMYYNQVVGMPSHLVASAILVALLVDCLLDPIIGEVSDNFRSRWGRRHPFMYMAALPAAGCFLLLWMPPQGWSDMALFAYVVVVAVLTRSFITLYEIPSSALVPELSEQYDERTTIVSYRYFFGVLGGVLLYVITLKVFLQPEPGFPVGTLNINGWWRSAVLAAALIVFSILLSAAATHHRIPYLHQGSGRRLPFVETLRAMGSTLSNRSFLAVTCFGVLSLTGSGIITALDLYVGTYFWKLAPSQLATIGISPLVGAAMALFLAPLLSRALGKRPAAVVSLVLSTVLLLIPIGLRFAGLFPENGSSALVPLLMLVAILHWSCIIVSFAMVTSMLADVVEDSAVKTGRRSEGLYFAANSLTQKAVSGMGVFVAGLLLTVVGFPQGARPESVDPGLIDRLVLIFVPTLVVFHGLGLLCLLGYRIDRQQHAENLRRLKDDAIAAEAVGEAAPAPPPVAPAAAVPGTK